MTVALVGASGFVGRHVGRHLDGAGVKVKPVPRSGLSAGHDLSNALRGCQWVVNCAGQKRPDRYGRWEANDRLPALLYRTAVEAGCSGMVHVSSAAAIATTSGPGAPIDDNRQPRPDSAYGQSKARGDDALEQLRDPRTKLCILRPPLLIGSDAGGVFGFLRKAALAGLPLPLSGIAARRSMMHVDNFAEAVSVAIDRGLDGTFIVTDGMVFTPPDLYALMLRHAGHPNRCFSIGPVGRAMLRLMLGPRRGNSLFAHSEFDSSRFDGQSRVRYSLAPDRAISVAMGRVDGRS